MAIEGFEDLDFHAFHRDRLPGLLADGRGAMAARSVHERGSLAFRLPDGAAYTYAPRDDGVEILSGDERADTLIALDHASWEGLVHDYESAPGLLYPGRVKCLRGHAMAFVHWEQALRALYTGRPVYEADEIVLQDRAGRPLEADRTFTLDDDREELAHFLRITGYLLLRDVFERDEIAGFLKEARSLRAEARKGDRLSWWARNGAGDEILCRVTRAADKPRLATLPSDPRVLALKELSDHPLVHRRGEGSGVTVIYKNPGIAEGLSDLPWHRDCGMGGHSVMCPVLLASVYLTAASPETGELRFLPGSWSRTCGFMEATDPKAPRGVGFRAQPGDVSIHYGDVMHAAPPPTRSDLDGYRISAVTGFAHPASRNHRGEGSYNDVLHQREDGQIEHLAKVAGRV